MHAGGLSAKERPRAMVFNSVQYLAFFPVAVVGYFLLPRRVRVPWLLLASLYFVGAASPIFALQTLVVVILGWTWGLVIERSSSSERKSRLVTVGVLALLGNLFVFKYAGFVNESLRSVFGWSGRPYPVPVLQLLFPLGISFYTFQVIAYLVDVARGERAERSVTNFGLFVAFFPKFVSGPIERGKRLLPQLRQDHDFEPARIIGGIELMAWGFFKKIVVADRLAPFVSRVYDDPRSFDGVGMTLATWLFAFQVYCDFSGYTDIARGSAKVMGYELTENFNRPYLAGTVSDFWKRWHISLTSWLTDYVYTPLTRQRRVKLKLYYTILVSLFVTFVASGFWHGAEWTFVAWGALHGMYLVCSMLTQKWRSRAAKAMKLDRVPRLHRAWKVAVTFTLVCFAYVFFNAHDMSDAHYIVTHLFTGWSSAPAGLGAVLNGQWIELAFGLSGAAVVLLLESMDARGSVHELLAKRPGWVRWCFYQGCAVGILLFGALYDTKQSFIYFQF